MFSEDMHCKKGMGCYNNKHSPKGSSMHRHILKININININVNVILTLNNEGRREKGMYIPLQ
jgi:hypothetical protein